jgi:hypothetical protein
LWAKHLREFNEGPEDSLWNLSIDRSEIVDGHIMRRADEAKFARAGDIGICKALTSHNLRSIAQWCTILSMRLLQRMLALRL